MKKEMIQLTYEQYKSYKKAKKNLMLIEMMEMHLNYIIKYEIVIILENITVLLIIFVS